MWAIKTVVMAGIIAFGGLVATGASPAPASAKLAGPSHFVVGAFATKNADGYALVYDDGTVRPNAHGDASSLPLRMPIVGIVPWFVRGVGYYLIAADGGVFAFGNAFYPGSLGGKKLAAPIVGASPNKKYFRMVAADGGVFTFGDATYHGSLPGIGVRVRDVVGLVPTPSGNGYWIARRDGHVYAFGDAQRFGNAQANECDPIVAIVSNPDAQGYRVIRRFGGSQSFGVPLGAAPSTRPVVCGYPVSSTH